MKQQPKIEEIYIKITKLYPSNPNLIHQTILMSSYLQPNQQIHSVIPVNNEFEVQFTGIHQSETVEYQDQLNFPTITIHEVQDLQSQDEQDQILNKYCDDITLPEVAFFVNEKHHQILQPQDNLQSLNAECSQEQISIQTNIIDDMECGQFQVIVHNIESKSSIQQNQDQCQILFSKSQLEIPIDANEQTQPKTVPSTDYVNIWKKDQENDDDIYVQMLEEKWQRNQQQIQINKLNQPQNLIKDTQLSLMFLQQLCKVSSQTINKVAVKQDLPKKTGFVIKKLKDERSNTSTLNMKNLKSPKQEKNILKNKSQILNVKSQVKYQRYNKKHASHIQLANNSPHKNQCSNVQYEIILGNQIQKMSQILQNRCYNNVIETKIVQNNDKQNQLSPKIGQNSTKQRQSTQQQSINKVRKIIKRSPYGILQLEVKDKKNQAKITNLRILKPIQMTRLKKLPNIIKTNKENVFQ